MKTIKLKKITAMAKSRNKTNDELDDTSYIIFGKSGNYQVIDVTEQNGMESAKTLDEAKSVTDKWRNS